MNKAIIYIVILFLFLPVSKALGSNTAYVSFCINTDRNCYVSGDIAFFKLYGLIKSNPVKEQTVYVDLVSRQNDFISGVILKMRNGLASGYIEIPDSLITGKYKLRFYSDQSKNLESPFLSQKTIYVSNRFGKNEPIYKNDLQESENETDSTQPLMENEFCKISTLKDTFRCREKVSVGIDISDKAAFDTLWSSITVKPYNKNEIRFASDSDNENQKITAAEFQKQNLSKPGITLRGQLVYKSTSNIVKNAVVFLSFNDSVFRFQYSMTDNNGEFCFHLNHYTGIQKVYLSAFIPYNLQPLLNVQFNIYPNFIKSVNQQKPNDEIVTYRASVDTFNVEKAIITKAFQSRLTNHLNLPERDSNLWAQKYFLGDKTHVTYPAEYVNLPDFVSIAKEILPFVRYRKNGSKGKLFINDGESDIVRENPMLFVDGVPLTEVELIENRGTDKIREIDVRWRPRVFGDLLFQNGIIMIWSNHPDFWDLNTSKYISVYNLECYQPKMVQQYPDYSKASQHNLPDFRQTLYWNADIKVAKGQPASIDFYTSDEVGTFEIVLKGMDENGEPVTVSKLIKVE